MAITFEQFFQSIVAQESGGNYGAVGPPTSYGRAYGKYQVLASNIPSWTKQYYGRSLTPQQFLKDKAAQDAVARGKLQSYWNKYGPRGAASAWYSGNPNLHMSTANQQGGPSIKQYVDSVINRAGGLPSGGSSSSSPKSSGGSKPVAKLSINDLANEYGYTAQMLNAIPELKKLFGDMVKNEWSKDKFQAKLRETKWYRSLSSQERQYITLKYTDPATAKQKIDQAWIQVMQIGRQLGLTGANYKWEKLKPYAYNMVAKGWDEGRLRYELGRLLTPTGNYHIGEAGKIWDDIDSYAYGMGVKLSDSWVKGRVQNIARGIDDVNKAKADIAIMAKAQFPQWAKQIDGGQTVADIAMPYMQSMAQILELAPGSINLFDPTIKSTLSWVNPATQKKEAKPMWQFENDLRNDARWKKTQNAQDSLMQVAHQVLSDFGVKY